MKSEHPLGLLPPDAETWLKEAAKTPFHPPHDPLGRIKAIEKATEKTKRRYPELFRSSTQ